MQIGIIGLPNSTKTTIFNALTRGRIETAAYSSGKLEIHTAMVDVPDPRVDILSKMFSPRKTVRAQVQYNDIAGLARGIGEKGSVLSSSKGGIDGSLLNQIVQNDALLHVVRAFEDPTVPHIEETIDPARDLEILDTELILSDLAVVERRLERLEATLSKRGGTPAEHDAQLKEQALMQRFKPQLEAGKPLRDLTLSEDDLRIMKNLALVTAKPQLVLFNTGDRAVSDAGTIVKYVHQKTMLAALQGKLEMELAQMSPDDAQEFLKEYGIAEPGLSKVIRLSYALLGLQSFFTVGEDEVRAWTVRVGANAVEAAGVIHTDLARGFIRAEVISYADMISAGDMAEARKRGVLRLEGKEYVVQDGDILNIRFNV
ncbi:MAG: redox-regulated ATPase YchF [Chloroflexota bacterium]|nr:redox-regulated ATPase YchF [Chloroflexota bacterium]